MKILIINAGSSSLKYQLIDMQDESIIAKGICERIGTDGSKLTHKFGEEGKFVQLAPMPDHTAAMAVVMDALQDGEHGVIKSIDEIGAVGHRVLHGGMKFTASCIIDEPVIEAIKECIPLGPLHNPANLMGIEACQKIMPNTPMVAVFDTAFHQTMPEHAYLYAIPKEYYEKYQIRRYGFHGTSHRFVSARTIEILGAENAHKVVVCHLGNGASLSACVDGKCIDTSMGLTPLEGVVMGTRSGSVDPAVVECIANNEGLTVTETLNILNKKSGMLALTGVGSDMRDIWDAADAGSEDAKRALDVWAYSIKKYIGAYAAAMGGLD
ncbi:MAG: acetate kinase, partial [Eubacteriales bacterium]|nr:acetate kinase [Eubacteriales bacterium]